MALYSYNGTNLSDYNLYAGTDETTIDASFNYYYNSNNTTFNSNPDTIFNLRVGNLNYKINGTDIGPSLAPYYSDITSSVTTFTNIENKYKKIRVFLVGGGGGGGGSGRSRCFSSGYALGTIGGSGGSGGAGYIEIDISTGGYSYTVTIGTGGGGGTGGYQYNDNGTDGADGGSTTFTIKTPSGQETPYTANGGGKGYRGFYYYNLTNPPNTPDTTKYIYYTNYNDYGIAMSYEATGLGGSGGTISSGLTVTNGTGRGQDGKSLIYYDENNGGYLVTPVFDPGYGVTSYPVENSSNKGNYVYEYYSFGYRTNFTDQHYGSGGDAGKIRYNRLYFDHSGYMIDGYNGNSGINGFARVYFFP